MAEAKVEPKAGKAKAAKAAAPAAEKTDAMVLVIESRAKELVKAAELRSGEEFIAALNETVAGLVKSAAARARANGRVTLQPQDL
jgi:histone H3/H4